MSLMEKDVPPHEMRREERGRLVREFRRGFGRPGTRRPRSFLESSSVSDFVFIIPG